MSLRRAMGIAACLVCIAAGPAAAQWTQAQTAQPVQQQGSVWDRAPQQPAQSANSPWNQPAAAAPAPAASPWERPRQPPPCVAEFFKLRDAADKRAQAIRSASARKADPKEACALFNALVAAQAKMIKYATDNQQTCGIPPDAIGQMKQGQAQVTDIRTKVCRAAAAPARPTAPTLSDALTGPVPDSSNIKTGRGTFDTLTGSPLGSR